METNSRKITIDGQEILVPVGNTTITGRELRKLAHERAGASSHAVPYRITPDGHEVIEDNQLIEVQDGENFGTIERFVAGGPGWIE
jgi:hypothetical protein